MDASRTIFVTGFPGFIAGRLVEFLARGGASFYLLVQPDFVEVAKAAVEQIVLRGFARLEQFTIVRGDITSDSLGISPENFRTIAAEATDIFHLAAVYDLGVSQDVARRVNVAGTQNVNDAARQFTKLRRYNYVSTCYVAGRREGRILETELEHDAGFRNHYEESKYLAELSVEKLKGELPVSIFRPSIVVGDSQTGETAKYDGIYSLIHYLLKAPRLLRLLNVGNHNVRLNLVPVDFVVAGMAALSSHGNAEGKTVALADPEPLTTAELFNVIAKSLAGSESVIRPPAALVERSLMLGISPALTGLPHTGVPYFFISQSYETSVAAPLLSDHGITCPRFVSYAPRLIDFVKEHPAL